MLALARVRSRSCVRVFVCVCVCVCVWSRGLYAHVITGSFSLWSVTRRSVVLIRLLLDVEGMRLMRQGCKSTALLSLQPLSIYEIYVVHHLFHCHSAFRLYKEIMTSAQRVTAQSPSQEKEFIISM